MYNEFSKIKIFGYNGYIYGKVLQCYIDGLSLLYTANDIGCV